MATKSYDTIKYEVDGHKATITLNRPDALNALSPLHDHRAARRLRRGRKRRRRLASHRHRRRPRVLHRCGRQADPRGRQGHQRAGLPVHLRPVGGAPGGHPAVSPDGQAGAGRDQRNLLRRGPRLGHHRRHRHRIRDGHVLRPARQHRPGRRPRDGPAGARAAPQRRAAHGADGQARADGRTARLRPRHDQRGRRARPPARACTRNRRHGELAMRRLRFGAPGWPSTRHSTCRCTRARSSPRPSGSATCTPRTRSEGPRAFVEKRAPNWQCR